MIIIAVVRRREKIRLHQTKTHKKMQRAKDKIHYQQSENKTTP